jgi:hypothetical protein
MTATSTNQKQAEKWDPEHHESEKNSSIRIYKTSRIIAEIFHWHLENQLV